MIGASLDYFVSAVRIFTRDLRAARAFYNDTIGLMEVRATDHWAVFDLGGVNMILELALESDPQAQEMVGRYSGLSLSTRDVPKTYEELQEKGVRFLGPPMEQEWGGYLAHFYDADENIVSLVR